ncbi:MAG: hypothetical protein WA151_03580 [Desulfatirhabdiaceae bacterium]
MENAFRRNACPPLYNISRITDNNCRIVYPPSIAEGEIEYPVDARSRNPEHQTGSRIFRALFSIFQ